MQDGFRDGEHIRHQMHAKFTEWLQAKKRPYRLLSGPPVQRLADAVAAIHAPIPPLKEDRLDGFSTVY